ncbi:inner membrane protein [Paenibacillus phyllosphaerae]|uniref:Inner membrane protein n=1 Tax=Paenibacillus phyllosphaerae TaxID=274593 RepID=A0A7W5AXE3_9BACL|nr:inner membrane protein [Paenibacillus phyllosphaerae]
MDTGSHLLFGVTLAGLSMVDPHVAANPELIFAVLGATMIGSHAPDFDSVMRLKGQPSYIRNHRGITHSLPAPLCWSLLFGLAATALSNQWAHFGTIWLWTFIAVCFHITLDLFNAYGVQCLRPFSRKWWHLDVLCLFDPYLFGLHAAAAVLWAADVMPPAPLFVTVYVLTLLYIGWRTLVSRQTVSKLRNQFEAGSGEITLLPSLSGRSWQFVVETRDRYVIGRVRGNQITVEAEIQRTRTELLSPVAKATMTTDGVKVFLGFADRIHVKVQEQIEGYEVIWSDIRFWHNHKMPFGVAVTLDRDLNVLREQIGWNKKTWEPPHV